MKFCTKCGEPLNPNQKFCTKCGHHISNGADAYTEQTTLTSTPSNMEENTDKTFTTEILESNEEPSQIKSIKIPTIKENLTTNSNPPMSKIKQKHSRSKPILTISLCVIIVLAILGGIFNKPIANKYYLFKCNSTKDTNLKVDYSYKALSKVSDEKTKLIFEASLKEYVEKNVENAEEELNQYKDSLSEDTFISLSKSVYNSKAERFINKNMPKEAFDELVKIHNLKGDFKSNSSYEKILLGLVSSKLGVQGYESLTLLGKEKNIYVRNMDADVFDEIIQLEEKTSGYYSTELTINLYKFKDGEYKRLDSTSIDYLENIIDLGLYPYEKDKYGIFISGSMAKYSKVTYVYTIDNETINNLTSIGGYNFCRPVDIDKNGIYEIEAHVIDSTIDTSNYSNADMPLIKEVYTVGKDSTLISSEKMQTTTSTFNSNNLTNPAGYIFYDSNSRYLTDSDLYLLSKEQLELARNEIFARHGYMFNLEKYRNYFLTKSWYKPNPSYKGGEEILNEFEKANYKMIQKWESFK